MKKLLLLPLFFIACQVLSAQIGLSASYRYNEPDNWKLVHTLTGDETLIMGDGPAYGIDYWFRLKELRIEFLPELNFAQFKETVAAAGSAEAKINYLSFFLNTNFYLLDLFSDCDCPTFSKQSNLLSRGLFVQLSPGISRVDQKIDLLEQKSNSKAWSLSFGAALGYDVGFSNLVTLTPIIGVRYYLNTAWDDLSSINGGIKEWEVVSEESSLLQYYGGLRLGIRFYE